jgi:hypothetical protein
MLRLSFVSALAAIVALTTAAQSEKQPRVTPGPNEPDWVAILEGMFGLSMFGDLQNPVETTAEATPGLFRKAAAGPVKYTPMIALGLETTNRGGWYRPGKEFGRADKKELWAYTFKNTASDLENGLNMPPPLAEGSAVAFDPGDQAFGLWLTNDALKDGGVFTEPAEVKAVNRRLAAQPYKAMIYPFRDTATGKVVPNTYLIGWEYSTNDDFQDVVCKVENVELLRMAP